MVRRFFKSLGFKGLMSSVIQPLAHHYTSWNIPALKYDDDDDNDDDDCNVKFCNSNS